MTKSNSSDERKKTEKLMLWFFFSSLRFSVMFVILCLHRRKIYVSACICLCACLVYLTSQSALSSLVTNECLHKAIFSSSSLGSKKISFGFECTLKRKRNSIFFVTKSKCVDRLIINMHWQHNYSYVLHTSTTKTQLNENRMMKCLFFSKTHTSFIYFLFRVFFSIN